MGLVIIVLLGAIVFFIIALSSIGKNNSTPAPPSVREYQNSLKAKEEDREEDNIYRIPRNTLLRLLGWQNSPRNKFVGDYSIEIPVYKGYVHKKIVGTCYRDDVTIFDTGWFNGYAQIEPSNAYDSYAIKICRDDHKFLGYIPAGDVALFNYIKEQGGYVHIYGALAYNCWDRFWYGYACIEVNKSLLPERNEIVENEQLTFYTPTFNITEFLNEKQK